MDCDTDCGFGNHCVASRSYLPRNFRRFGSVGFDVLAFERQDSVDSRYCIGRLVRFQMEGIEQATMRCDSAFRGKLQADQRGNTVRTFQKVYGESNVCPAL